MCVKVTPASLHTLCNVFGKPFTVKATVEYVTSFSHTSNGLSWNSAVRMIGSFILLSKVFEKTRGSGKIFVFTFEVQAAITAINDMI